MKRYAQLAAVPMLFAAGSIAVADDAVIAGGVDIAFKTLELLPGQAKLKTSITSISPSLAYGNGRFYLSAAYERALTSEPRAETQQGSNYATTDQIYRSDIVLTAGYRVLDYLSVFAGWLQGESNFNLAGIRDSLAGLTYTIVEGSYVEKGPFVGLAFSHSFGNRGALSASIAYAILDGEISQTDYATVISLPPTATVNHAPPDSGQVKGLSYSLLWTGPLTGSLQYRVGAKYTNYKGTDIASTDGGIEEKYTSFFFGVTNFF